MGVNLAQPGVQLLLERGQCAGRRASSQLSQCGTAYASQVAQEGLAARFNIVLYARAPLRDAEEAVAHHIPKRGLVDRLAPVTSNHQLEVTM